MTVRLERRPHRNRDKRGGEEGRGKEEIEIRRDENKSGVRRERDKNLTISPSLLFSCLDCFCLFYSLLYFSPYPTFILISSHLYLHFYSTLFSSPLLAFNGVSSSLQPSHLFSPFLFFQFHLFSPSLITSHFVLLSSLLPSWSIYFHILFLYRFSFPSSLAFCFVSTLSLSYCNAFCHLLSYLLSIHLITSYCVFSSSLLFLLSFNLLISLRSLFSSLPPLLSSPFLSFLLSCPPHHLFSSHFLPS